jgi:hypothetical protein
MKHRNFYASLTRISDLEQVSWETAQLHRRDWASGDYVVGIVDERPSREARVELCSGRMVEMVEGERVVGALGERHATLEVVGSWDEIGTDGRFHALTAAGLFGKVSSISSYMPRLLSLSYEGHVVRAGRKVTMSDFVGTDPGTPYRIPTILLVGTSMSSGKTTSAKVAVRKLKEAGLVVVGAKLAGAGRFRDILGMQDAGADAVFDFVDVGLPSSICSAERFRELLRHLLHRIAALQPDVVVAESGASPLEDYNGQIVMEEIREQVRCTILCASDPYAVVGVIQGFSGFRIDPDVITGVGTSTTAGVNIVERLTGKRAINLLDRSRHEEYGRLMLERLRLERPLELR